MSILWNSGLHIAAENVPSLWHCSARRPSCETAGKGQPSVSKKRTAGKGQPSVLKMTAARGQPSYKEGRTGVEIHYI